MIIFFGVMIHSYLVIFILIHLIITIICFFLNWTCDKSIEAKFKMEYPELATFLTLYPDLDYIGQMMNELSNIFCCICPFLNILMLFIMLCSWTKTRDDSVEKMRGYAFLEYEKIKNNIKQETGKNLDDELLAFMNKSMNKQQEK